MRTPIRSVPSWRRVQPSRQAPQSLPNRTGPRTGKEIGRTIQSGSRANFSSAVSNSPSAGTTPRSSADGTGAISSASGDVVVGIGESLSTDASRALRRRGRDGGTVGAVSSTTNVVLGGGSSPSAGCSTAPSTDRGMVADGGASSSSAGRSTCRSLGWGTVFGGGEARVIGGVASAVGGGSAGSDGSSTSGIAGDDSPEDSVASPSAGASTAHNRADDNGHDRRPEHQDPPLMAHCSTPRLG